MKAETGRAHWSMWVHEILWVRKHLREEHHLVQELKLDGAWFKEYFQNFLQLSSKTTEVLVFGIDSSNSQITYKDLYRILCSIETLVFYLTTTSL